MRQSATLLAALALAFPLSLPVMAQSQWNPPARYDKPFHGKMYVYRVPPERVAGYCRDLFAKARLQIFVWPTQVGCAAFQDDICVIYIRDRTIDGITPEAIQNHERGHCNGWGADHED